MSDQPNLGVRAAGNLIGGSGAGLLIVASLGAFGGLYSGALLAAGTGVAAAGMLSVLPELGRLPRAWRGWLVRQAIAAAVLFPLAIAAVVLPLLVKLVWMPALVFLYCQARALEVSTDVPAWRSPLIMPLMIVTGIAEGAGLLLLLAPLALETAVPEWVAGVLIAAVAARQFVWMSYRRRMTGGEAPIEAAAELLAFSTPFALGGNVMPMVLAMAVGVMPEMGSAALAAAGLAAVGGGWALKVIIVTKAAHGGGAKNPG